MLTQHLGPIIRINPHELSIYDPAFYNELYVSGSKRRSNIPKSFLAGVDFEGDVKYSDFRVPSLTDIDSFFLTRSHDLHKIRRQPFEKGLSRKSIQSQQQVLASLAMTLESRIIEYKDTGKSIRLDHAISCYTGDIIEAICFSGDEFGNGNLLQDPEFAPAWYCILVFIFKYELIITLSLGPTLSARCHN
jgi:hypothetical protein